MTRKKKHMSLLKQVSLLLVPAVVACIGMIVMTIATDPAVIHISGGVAVASTLVLALLARYVVMPAVI